MITRLLPKHARPTSGREIQILDILRTNTRFKLLTLTVPTWLQWVLNVEHRGPVAIHQILLNLIFGNIATSIFDSDARFQVVEVASVQLKEFNEQNTNIDVGTAHVLPVVKLENTQFEWMSELF